MYISLALNFINLLVFLSEMKKVLIFVASALMFINGTHAAVRDGGVASRAKNGTSGISQQRLTNSTTVSRSSVASLH